MPWALGSGAEPVRAEHRGSWAAVRAELVLGPVDFCPLMGGRVDPAGVPRGVRGSVSAADQVLARAASPAWL
ncbi:hypothetical protein ACFVXC_28225 [Streptomyces sp. NPDC058257]|uniref:hypothetical protein n=1 Tax=Streptomyces sp. NPDC058257 TaxID=3346409 RepID=UPI0036F1790A